MKRLTIILFALWVFLGSGARGHAAELIAGGQMDFIFGFSDNLAMTKDADDNDHFFARQRARVAFEMMVVENLKGVVQLQYGGMNWGREGAALDANRESAKIRRAYVDWSVAGTSLNFKVGIHHLALPSYTFGNLLFSANVAGITAAGDFSPNLSMFGFWARPFNDDANGFKDNQTDLFGLGAVIDYEAFKLSPWLSYGSVGNNSGLWGYRANAGGHTGGYNPAFGASSGTGDLLAGGVALEVFVLDGVGLHLDALYAHLDSDGNPLGTSGDDMKASGWMLNLLLDYRARWGTPGLLGWYASGDDEGDVDDNKFGRLPTIGTDDGFTPGRLAFPGAVSWGDDAAVTRSGVGTWGLGLQVKDLSFMERLRHTARVIYMQGTNDKKVLNRAAFFGETQMMYLTTRDSLVEFGLDSEYRIYENLAAYLEIGYIMTDISEETMRARTSSSTDKDADLFNAQFTLRYDF